MNHIYSPVVVNTFVRYEPTYDLAYTNPAQKQFCAVISMTMSMRDYLVDMAKNLNCTDNMYVCVSFHRISNSEIGQLL